MIDKMYQINIFEHTDWKVFVFHNDEYYETTQDIKNLILDLLENYDEWNNEKCN